MISLSQEDFLNGLQIQVKCSTITNPSRLYHKIYPAVHYRLIFLLD